MAPIPVYTDSPVAVKPDGVTPQTADQPPSNSGTNSTPVTTTSAPGQPLSGYPQARPGAVPSLPAVTAAAQAYTPFTQPTPTQSLQQGGGPAPPQPGAVPVPATRTAKSPLPPPPKVGEKFVPPPPQVTPLALQPTATYPPPQMGIPPPTAAYPAQQLGTSIAAPPPSTSSYYAGGIIGQQKQGNAGGYPGQNPSGYQQDVNASGLDGYQSAALQNETRNHLLSDPAEEEVGVWNAAKKWAQATGEKLAAAETEVWKKINKE